MATPLRSIRVPEELWAQMKELATLQETNISALLIRLMKEELER
jgi:predicted DNA-binding ribbon-helix-helix protein